MYFAKTRPFGYEPKTVTFNLDEMGKLPNYSFKVRGVPCYGLEQYVRIMKALKTGDRASAIKLQEMSETQVRSGKLETVEIRGTGKEVWKKIKLKVLKLGMYYEFSQNKELAEKLIDTKDDEIVVRTHDNSVWAFDPKVMDEVRGEKKAYNLFSSVLMELRELLQLQKEVYWNLWSIAGLRTELVEATVGFPSELRTFKEEAVRKWLRYYEKKHDLVESLADFFIDNWAVFEELLDGEWMEGFKGMRWNALIQAAKKADLTIPISSMKVLADIKQEYKCGDIYPLTDIDSMEPVVWIDMFFGMLMVEGTLSKGISTLARRLEVPERLFRDLLEDILNGSISRDRLLDGLSFARVYQITCFPEYFDSSSDSTRTDLQNWLQSKDFSKKEATIVVNFMEKFYGFRKEVLRTVSTTESEVKGIWELKRSGKCAEELIEVGDLLTDELLRKVSYPAAIDTYDNYAQVCEPDNKSYNSETDERRSTHKTFEKISEGVWKYCGVFPRGASLKK